MSDLFKVHGLLRVTLLALAWLISVTPALTGEFSAPWRDKSKPIILDAYEKNPIDWRNVVTNEQIFGFIGKGSDGLPPPWACKKPNNVEQTLCKKTFQNYWLKKELYKTRKTVAKSLGLKWGAYHLGRPGNPIAQANHFIDFTDPDDDDLLAIDIEHDDPDKWISLEDAEIFAEHIKRRLGRYPVLYTNHNTAKRIAARRAELPILSRLPLWYARFRSNINGAFPMGHWDSYAIWQFSAHPNCNKRRCLYRVAGTKTDIDVNVGRLNANELEKAWPFGGLVPKREEAEEQNPKTLMVSVDEKIKTASTTPIAASAPITRFKTKLSIDNLDGAQITLSSIAIPTPRKRNIIKAVFEVAALELPVEHLGYQQSMRGYASKMPSTQKTQPAFNLADAERPKPKKVAAASFKRSKASYGYSNKMSYAAAMGGKAR